MNVYFPFNNLSLSQPAICLTEVWNSHKKVNPNSFSLRILLGVIHSGYKKQFQWLFRSFIYSLYKFPHEEYSQITPIHLINHYLMEQFDLFL